jgi:hypothetical protein
LNAPARVGNETFDLGNRRVIEVAGIVCLNALAATRRQRGRPIAA